MTKNDNNDTIGIVFDCYYELDICRRRYLDDSGSPEFCKLVKSLSIQTMPFIAVGGINDILTGEASITSAANIMDAVLDGLVGVSNRDIKWDELRNYCISEGCAPDPYEAVIDWIPGEAINQTFDYVCNAIKVLGESIIYPLTIGKRYNVIDITIIDPVKLRVKATLNQPRYSITIN